MTASRIHPSAPPAETPALVAPVVDFEPPPVGVAACPPPRSAALRRRSPTAGRGPRQEHLRRAAAPEPAARAATVFADAALRRVLEVIDRRRPTAQLRPLLTPALIETVLALTRFPQSSAATLRRIRVRMVDDDGDFTRAAEVFGTYSRGPRVRAVAARVAFDGQRWRIVALQIG
ncbi:hypothetical protein H7J88_10550 [Mycolicibacterium flavescens]|uniref:Alanine, arginine and proline rich protein n=1 Tax=Mycolicibacterium flavescens TaxID=1776 RepID=A0A1E3RCP2_MYCFV|nr:Rv3235 family protein [Mycolicibacterium flavescens]MCV7280087.1 hypothetical protein [Mycolicibacterium flavescens]ODQ87644.1 hypothetical protein BHQ18_22815 [Mycolicibacterium flavescens]